MGLREAVSGKHQTRNIYPDTPSTRPHLPTMYKQLIFRKGWRTGRSPLNVMCVPLYSMSLDRLEASWGLGGAKVGSELG